MSTLFEEKWSWIESSHGLRSGLLENTSDAELAFNPGGQNITLGALFREIGEIEQSYIDSFKTFKQDFSYHNPDPSIETSVERLKAWYQAMEDEFKAALSAISDADAQKTILRPSGYTTPPSFQIDIYVQALMIFFGKAVIYFRAMNKPLPPSVQEYIA